VFRRLTIEQARSPSPESQAVVTLLRRSRSKVKVEDCKVEEDKDNDKLNPCKVDEEACVNLFQ